jgi:hypothetical protein
MRERRGIYDPGSYDAPAADTALTQAGSETKRESYVITLIST